jgi:hypothetical protein
MQLQSNIYIQLTSMKMLCMKIAQTNYITSLAEKVLMLQSATIALQKINSKIAHIILTPLPHFSCHN